MKNSLRRARPAEDRACDTELYAASAKEKAIACLSTDVRSRCNSKVRSDGNAPAKRRTFGIPAECLAAWPPYRLSTCAAALCVTLLGHARFGQKWLRRTIETQPYTTVIVGEL
jgi:hypothetical protein